MSLSENVEHRRAEIVDLLHAEPNCVVLLIDVWFRIPEYMFQIRGNLALVPLAKAMATVYCESDSVEIRAIVERELSRRVQGSGHRLFRHVARLLRILLTLSNKEEDGGVLASLELSSQLLVDRTHSLHPSVLPRDMINVCVALVRRHAGQPYEVVAQAACFFLEQAWTLTADLRPIIWALQEGVLPNILCMKQPKLRKGDPMVLLKQLQPALSHRRVLRTFWHVYQRDKLSIEKAPWHPKILDDLIERAEKHWAIFEKLQKEWDATTTHCHNPDCPLPALDLYQCPCKTAYYCSRECQRENWKDDHRTKCHFFRWDLIEETKVPLPHPLYNSRDIDFLTQINKAFMDDHLNEVFEEAKKIDPTLMKTFNLTVGWGRGEPKYWVGVARYFIQPKMVIMQTGLIMGSEFTLVTLPGATLELNDTDDEEEGEGNKEDGDERDADENDKDETKDSDGDEDTETQSDESAELEAID
ncbi:hypothetical protein EV715DRAFT_287587 [Schizophyllum commune]